MSNILHFNATPPSCCCNSLQTYCNIPAYCKSFKAANSPSSPFLSMNDRVTDCMNLPLTAVCNLERVLFLGCNQIAQTLAAMAVVVANTICPN